MKLSRLAKLCPCLCEGTHCDRRLGTYRGSYQPPTIAAATAVGLRLISLRCKMRGNCGASEVQTLLYLSWDLLVCIRFGMVEQGIVLNSLSATSPFRAACRFAECGRYQQHTLPRHQ